MFTEKSRIWGSVICFEEMFLWQTVLLITSMRHADVTWRRASAFKALGCSSLTLAPVSSSSEGLEVWFVRHPLHCAPLTKRSEVFIHLSLSPVASVQSVLLGKVNGLILEHSLGSDSSIFGLQCFQKKFKTTFALILRVLDFFVLFWEFHMQVFYITFTLPSPLLIHPEPSPCLLILMTSSSNNS